LPCQNHLEANHQTGSETLIVLVIVHGIIENWRRFAKIHPALFVLTTFHLF
jgi:hypothetical protein